MRAVVQRVSWARVKVAGEVVGAIDRGLLVLLGVGSEDADRDADTLARKIVGLRVFEDDDQNMNLSLHEVGGSVLVVSQFTLYGDCRKGRRPSFIAAMEPQRASDLCDRFTEECRKQGVEVATGQFRAMMDVELCNDGPVTLLLDSHKLF